LKNLELSKSEIFSFMAENNLTHQTGLTRTNCAWIALNLLLNILMCYFVLQTRPRPNQTSMNPYYGPSNVWDLPRDYDDVLAQIEAGSAMWSDATTNQYLETMKERPTGAKGGRIHGHVSEMRVLKLFGGGTLDISWRDLPVVLVFGNPQRFFVTPINKLIGEDLAPRVGATWASGVIRIAMETLKVAESATSAEDLAALKDLMQQWYDPKDQKPLIFDGQKLVIASLANVIRRTQFAPYNLTNNGNLKAASYQDHRMGTMMACIAHILSKGLDEPYPPEFAFTTTHFKKPVFYSPIWTTLFPKCQPTNPSGRGAYALPFLIQADMGIAVQNPTPKTFTKAPQLHPEAASQDLHQSTTTTRDVSQ